MASQYSRADGMPPKRSSLEEDDGSHFYSGATSAGPHLSKQYLIGRGGMDVCDSGVSLTSLGCETLPSLDVSDPVKPQMTDQQTFVSVGYTSFTGPEDIVVDSELDGQLEGLSITCSSTDTTTSTTASIDATPCPATKPVNHRKAYVDKLRLCFTPDADGDT